MFLQFTDGLESDRNQSPWCFAFFGGETIERSNRCIWVEGKMAALEVSQDATCDLEVGICNAPSGYAREGQEYAILGLHYKDLSGRG